MKKVVVLTFFLFYAKAASAGFVIGHEHTELADIPDEWITAAKEELHIAYNHTSHGSQLITGMNALEAYPAFSSKYSWVNSSQGSSADLSLHDGGIPGVADLSQGDADSDGDGIANWAEDTYNFLNNPDNNHINVIMWSWCNIAGHDIDMYLNSMEWLIAQFSEGGTHARASTYPVQFVFMTAHANGGGEGDSADVPNEQIRAHVAAHDRILFDFSDIENYDPDENYYLDKLLNDALYYDSNGDGSRNANWASEYLVRHDDSELDRLTTGNNVDNYGGAGSCAHSDGPNNEARLNCVLKGRATWHLFARLAGWDGGNNQPVICSDYNGDLGACEVNGCTYCSANNTCGESECCGDQAGLCSDENTCTSAGYNWCGSSCQAEACPIDIRFDVDQSAAIDASDALLVLRKAIGRSMSSTAWQDQTNTGDADCDGTTDSADALLILRHSLGLDMSGTEWCG